MQTSKCPENLRKASLYHVDAGHNHRIVFALVVFHFLTKQGMRGGRLFALCLGIEFLNLEANRFGKIVSLACSACSIMLLSAKGNSGILSVGDPMHFEKFEPDHEDELRCRILKPRNGLSSSCFHLQIALFCVLLEH